MQKLLRKTTTKKIKLKKGAESVFPRPPNSLRGYYIIFARDFYVRRHLFLKYLACAPILLNKFLMISLSSFRASAQLSFLIGAY